MTKKLLAGLVLTALCITGCVVTSVHPYFTAKDVIQEPLLVGQWTNTQEAGQSWVFVPASAGGYNLNYLADGKTNLSLVRMFKLDGQRFLDFVSAEPESETFPPSVPTHFLLRVDRLDPTLRLAPLNHEWLRALLEKDPKALGHALIGSKADDLRVLLTGETSELQQFIRANLETKDAWKDSFDLERVAISAGTAPVLRAPPAK